MTETEIRIQPSGMENLTENIKIERNSRGYNYEFRILTLDVEAVRKKILEINVMINSLVK